MFLRALSAIITTCMLVACSGGGSGQSEFVANEDIYDFANTGLVSVDAQAGVLANDKGKQLVASLTTGPIVSDGFVLNPDGSFTYKADSEVVFNDEFEYSIMDADGRVQHTFARITVYPGPVAVPDEYRVLAGKVNSISIEEGVLSNDQIYRAGSSAVLLSKPGQAAAFALNADGSFSYTPVAGADGVDTFSYRIQDGLHAGAKQSVELVIDTGVFSGQPDKFTVESGKILALQPLEGLLKNDDGLDDASVIVQKLPRHAIDFSISSVGALVYRTVTENATEDHFSYALQKEGQTLGPFEVSLEITQANASINTPWFYDQCKEYPAGDTVDATLSALDVEGASFERVSSPRFGTITSFDGASGQFSYTRLSAHRGQDAFSYRIYDAAGNYVADASQELIALPYRVMPVGDSITSGVEFYDESINTDTPASNVRVGYRKFLKDRLTAEGYTIDLVGSRNEGYDVSGFTDYQHNGYPGVSDVFTSNNIEQWLNTTGADVILMHIGTNATKTHTEHIESIGSKIDSWEQQENNPVTLMLAKLIARTDNTSKASAVRNFNGLLEAYVNRRVEAGDRIHLVDQYNALGADGSYLSPDRLHPGIDGYRKMSDEWIKRLKETQAIAKCS